MTMKNRALLLIMAIAAAFQCFATQSDIEKAFVKLSQSKYVYASENYSSTSSGNKAAELRVIKFRIPESKTDLINNATRALDDIENATFKACKKGDGSDSYSIAFEDNKSVIVGGADMNVYIVSIPDESTENFRTVYAIEWKTKGDIIEGKTVYANSPKPDNQYKDVLTYSKVTGSKSDLGQLASTITINRENSTTSWLSKFEFYCNGIQQYNDTSSIVSAYANKIYKLTCDCSILDEYELSLVQEQLEDIFEKFEDEDVSIVVKGLLKKSIKNIQTAIKTLQNAEEEESEE